MHFFFSIFLFTLFHSCPYCDHLFCIILVTIQTISSTFMEIKFSKKNKTNDAIRMLEQCIYLEPAYVPAYLGLFKLYRNQGIKPGKMLSKAIQSNPNNLELRLKYGYWLIENRMYFFFLYFLNIFLTDFLHEYILSVVHMNLQFFFLSILITNSIKTLIFLELSVTDIDFYLFCLPSTPVLMLLLLMMMARYFDEKIETWQQ